MGIDFWAPCPKNYRPSIHPRPGCIKCQTLLALISAPRCMFLQLYISVCWAQKSAKLLPNKPQSLKNLSPAAKPYTRTGATDCCTNICVESALTGGNVGLGISLHLLPLVIAHAVFIVVHLRLPYINIIIHVPTYWDYWLICHTDTVENSVNKL